MVKGINKQMIVLKIDGNRFYESACFVLKNEAPQAKDTEKEMLREANRLIEGMELKPLRRKRRLWRGLLFSLLLLVIGAIGGFALSFFI